MRNRLLCLLLPFAFTCSALALGDDPSSPASKCADLKQAALPHASITLAETVAAGAFTPPGLKKDEKVPHLYATTPAFCRVVATLKPSADSDIKVEVWLPVSGWNGRFRGQGNGGFAGYIAYEGLATSVAQGYAAASTDTGHSTTDAVWALDHPEKIVDYGYRAVHEMTADAKTVIKAFYGDDAKRSYFASCSNGGRQALMEAQRFPNDYDGIIAGAPANNWVPMLTGGLNLLQATAQGGYIAPAKIPTISKAVLAACDAQDGVADGVLNDPRQCHFDPSTLLCGAKESDTCLTARQVNVLKTIYAGAHDTAGRLIFPGLLPGAEEGRSGWENWVMGSEPGKSAAQFFVTGYFANMVYDKSNWDFKTVKIDDALKLGSEKTGDSMNATNPDLKPFLAHGKLIMYHGWNDPGISALNSVNYYNSAVAAVGSQTADQSLRLYMVPGMRHCSGGPGATAFGQDEDAARSAPDHDIFAALVQWVEDEKAPSAIVATKFSKADRAHNSPQVEMTRPLCPYPQAAKYSGSGNQNLATSFSCVTESK
jgi:Tannase and feruloyl esterase